MDSRRRHHLLRLSGVAVAMFVAGFAMAPLYNALCELTGFNGKSAGLAIASEAPEQPDLTRSVNVEFVTTVNGGKPWRFVAETPRVSVHPGQYVTVWFEAQNTEDRAIVAQAVPSVTPWDGARHLKKTECFCFRRQPFAAGETRRLPVRFMLDPQLPASLDTVTLSYTIFDVTDQKS
ncbi:MAG TPA: cytochrome c oxidase assembly protein [Candidatus Binatia bacterium]|nr:cytochrome c oxidase assembly protein [Candidatus Binatia bacterium]